MAENLKDGQPAGANGASFRAQLESCSLFPFPIFPEQGGLMCYGVNFPELSAVQFNILEAI